MVETAVHFGSGSIGRGFIGQLLHNSSFSVKMVDVNEQIIDEINKDGGYYLYLINHDYEKIFINDVSAINSAKNPDEAIQEISNAKIITTSVLANNLKFIAPVLAKGLKKRFDNHAEKINVLACENLENNSQILRQLVIDQGILTDEEIDQVAKFPNTEVDRLVLKSERDGHDAIDIGDEFELVIDEKELVDPTKHLIKEAFYTDDLTKYFERKLYIINTGHCWAGYVGHIYGYEIMQDVLANEYLLSKTKEAMRESASLIHVKHGFTVEELDKYIDFAMGRFLTPGVIDTIARVSRNPILKVGPNERLVQPVVQLKEAGLDYSVLLKGISAVFLFDLETDKEAVELQKFIQENSIEDAITKFTGFEAGSELYKEVLDNYNYLKDNKKI